MRLELVRDWMSRDLVTVSPETPVREAGNLMVERNVRRLPVTASGALVGILTYNDLRGLPEAGGSLLVGDAMTAAPLTVSPNDTVGQAAEIMLQHRIGGLPVLDSHGALVGLITESDIFKLVVRQWMVQKGDESVPYARYD